MSSVSLTDLKLHVNSTSNVNDDELADFLDAAVEVVEGIVGPIGDSTVIETHRGVCSSVLVLRQMPVVALTAVASRYGATTTPLMLGDYELDVETGLVRTVSGLRFSGDYVVSYTTGREVLPAAIRLAVLEIARHLFETQRGPSPVGPLAPAEDEFAPPGLGFAIPNRARELLAPYVRPVIA